MKLYAHPFSSYSQKVLIALWENATPFTYRSLEEPSANAEFEALWPLKRFPILRDGETTVLESSVIIEHLAVFHPGDVELVPRDPALALEVRMMDRLFDMYVMTPMQKFTFNQVRPNESDRDPYGVREAAEMLNKAYAWLETTLEGRTWACGETFTMADCSAAPALFYADWVHRIPETARNVKAYRARLLDRPSIKRAVDEARPYRKYFPFGDPKRD